MVGAFTETQLLSCFILLHKFSNGSDAELVVVIEIILMDVIFNPTVVGSIFESHEGTVGLH